MPSVAMPSVALPIAAARAVAACSPAAEKSAPAPAQAEIVSSTAPAVGGPAQLPTDGGVTPVPDAMAGATAEQAKAPVSPARAAELSGGEQKTNTP